MRPQVGATIGEPSGFTPVKAVRPEGTAKFGWLGRLKASARNCRVRPRPSSKVLTRDTSTEKSPDMRPWLERAKGRSQVPLKVRLCLAWKAERPRSRSGSYQSIPYCTTLEKSCELMPLESSTERENVYDSCVRHPWLNRFCTATW